MLLQANLSYTKHAETRCQQRGISKEAVSLILTYGRKKYDHHGGVVHYLDHKTKGLLLNKHSEVKTNLDKQLKLYVVTSAKSGQVITTGHRYRRIYN